MKNHFFKALAIGLFLLAMPLKQQAQQPTFANQVSTIEFDITEINLFDERIIFLYNLVNDSRFDVVNSERDGVFIISVDPAYEGMDLSSSFADFKQQNNIQLAGMNKEQVSEIAMEYKALLSKEMIQSLMMDVYIKSRQNNLCASADPFCTDNGMYQFPAGVNAGSGESGPNYNCLSTTPNPAWYYMRIGTPGSMTIHMYSTPSHDIDFCCWGPFEDPTTPCPNGLVSGKVVSCSYSSSSTENCQIPSSAQTGQFYILVITNYSNATCNISFSKTAGTGTTDCDILPPLVSNNGPYCVGETITLTGNAQSGASYSWSGPGGWTATGSTVTRPNCNLNHAGTYTCTISLNGQTNSSTTNVVVYANPIADFNANTVCFGEATQFTSTSTTNPSGQQITSYLWDFGDGQTSTQQNPTHQFTTAGSHNVSLTVKCGNDESHCSDTKQKTVTTYAQPVASFTATTACLGEATQFTSTSTTNPSGQAITSYLWDFGDGSTSTQQNPTHTYANSGNYNVTLTVGTNGNCSNATTIRVSVSPQPIADFTVSPTCLGDATQFTNTSTTNPSGQLITDYLWDFGDGGTSTEQNPTHTYATSGTYTVSLTASIGESCSDVKTNTEVIVYPKPAANFTATTACFGNATQFTSTSTTNPPDQEITSYLWDFGDGETSTEHNPSHIYNNIGSFDVTLTVGTGDGSCTDSKTNTVTVVAQPSAGFTATTVCQGEATAFTNTSATSPEGQAIHSYLWNFGDGETSTEQHPTHTYANAGDFNVTLTVDVNNTCNDSITQIVTVYAMPQAEAGEDQTANYGDQAQLHGSAGVDGEFNYHWEPADKMVNPNEQHATTKPLHEETTFTLTVTHPQGGCSTSDQVTVLINGSDMTASVKATPNAICLDETSQLMVTAIGGTGNYTYLWSPATGLSSPNIANPTAHPTETTTYSCIVSDGYTSRTLSVTVTVNYPEFEEFTQYICPDESFTFNNTEYSDPGDYVQNTTTSQGCNKTITLHLFHYPTYPNAHTTREFICSGESYPFHGHNYTSSGLYPETLQTIHGCDSIVWLDLTVYPPNDTTIVDPTICTSQTYNFHGRIYNQDGIIDYFDTIDNHGCLKVEKLILSVGPYQMPPKQYQYECYAYNETPSYYWDKTGRTYTQDTYDEIILPDPDGGCDIKYRLDLKFHQEFYQHDTIVVCDDYLWPVDGMHYTESAHLYKPFTSGGPNFECDSIYEVELTVNHSSTGNQLYKQACNEYTWDFGWNDESYTFTESGVYTKTIETSHGCDSIVTLNLTLDYSPTFPEIKGRGFVVGGSEFQYTVEEYYIQTNGTHHTTWELEDQNGRPFNKWDIVPFGDSDDHCYLYIYTFELDPIILIATTESTGAGSEICGENFSKTKRIHCGNYGTDEIMQRFYVDIFPNPNDGNMTLSFTYMEGDIEVTVYNMQGTQVDQFHVFNGFEKTTHIYNSHKLAPGVYFIHMAGKEGSLTKKIVIIK